MLIVIEGSHFFRCTSATTSLSSKTQLSTRLKLDRTFTSEKTAS